MRNFLCLLALLSVTAHGSPTSSPVPANDLDDSEWTILGESSCWRDTIDGVRALEFAALGFDGNYATPDTCREACAHDGFTFAAVEHGHECWCGNTIRGKAHSVPESYCNEPCAGDEMQMCGGYGYMNIWALKHPRPNIEPPREGWKIMACYKDIDANHRQLNWQPPKIGGEPERERTIEGCIDACAHYRFTYAGLENGGECYCGQRAPAPYLEGGKCDMPCHGDARQLCGGQDALLVFIYNPTGGEPYPGEPYPERPHPRPRPELPYPERPPPRQPEPEYPYPERPHPRPRPERPYPERPPPRQPEPEYPYPWRPAPEKPYPERPYPERPPPEKPYPERPYPDRPERPYPERPYPDPDRRPPGGRPDGPPRAYPPPRPDRNKPPPPWAGQPPPAYGPPPVPAIQNQATLSAGLVRRDVNEDGDVDDSDKFPKLPKLPKLPFPIPGMPDMGDIVKRIKPLISDMFKKIQADVAMTKKSVGGILDHIPKGGSSDPASADQYDVEFDAWLHANLKDAQLDPANPIGDAIGKIKLLIAGLFDKVKADLESAKTQALLLLDHLPGGSGGVPVAMQVEGNPQFDHVEVLE